MLVWEKIIVWVLVGLFIIIMAIFLVNQFGSGETSLISKLFGMFEQSGSAIPTVE